MKKVLVTKGKKLIGALTEEFGANECAILPTEIGTLLKVLEWVENQNFEKDALFFIDVEIELDGGGPASSKGIEVLKYLRLKNYLQHCVMFSIVSLSELLKEHPERIILCSKGVTFVHTIDVLNVNVKNTPQESSDLKPYFKNDYIVSDDRHSVANWWGVYCLYKIQHIIEVSKAIRALNEAKKSQEGNIKELEQALEKLQEEKPEATIPRAWKEMNSYQGIVAQYFNKIESDSIIERVKMVEESFEGTQPETVNIPNSTDETHKESYSNLGTELHNATGRSFSVNMQDVRKNFREFPPKIIYVDDQADDGWANVFKRIIYGTTTTELFKTVKIEQNTDTEQNIASKIREAQKAFFQMPKYMLNPMLLILDLRLFSTENTRKIEEVSGIKVLELLKNDSFPSFPIMVVSASNKINFFAKTITLGALFYWQKKGLEEINDTESIIANYYDFIKSVHTICYNENIQLIYRSFLPGIQILRTERCLPKQKFWWLTSFWEKEEILMPKDASKGRTLKCSDQGKVFTVEYQISFANTLEDRTSVINTKENKVVINEGKGKKKKTLDTFVLKPNQNRYTKILSILEGAANLYLALFRNQIMLQKTDLLPDKINSLIVMYLYDVVEEVYKFESENLQLKGGALRELNAALTPSKVFNFKELSRIRNNASHRYSVTTNEICEYIKHLFLFLYNDEPPQNDLWTYRDVEISTHIEKVIWNKKIFKTPQIENYGCIVIPVQKLINDKNIVSCLWEYNDFFLHKNLKIKGLEAVGSRTYFVPIEVQFENEALVQESLKNVEKKSQNSSKSSSFVLFKDQEYTTTVRGIDEQKRCLLLSPLSPETIGEKYMCENVINYISERDILVAFNDLSSLERFKNRIGENINFKPDEVKLGSLFATLVADLWNEEIYESTITEVNNKWVKLSPVEEGGFPVKAKVENIVLPKGTSKREDYLKVGRTLKFTIKNITDVWVRPERIWVEEQIPLESKQE
jgi:hypothetical protein